MSTSKELVGIVNVSGKEILEDIPGTHWEFESDLITRYGVVITWKAWRVYDKSVYEPPTQEAYQSITGYCGD